MAKLTQSTLVPMTPDKVFELLEVTPEHLVLSPTRPSITYTAEEGIKVGAKLRYTLIFGVLKFSWLGVIRSVQLGERIECELAEGPFDRWAAVHAFARDGRQTAVREVMEYECESEKLLEVMDKALMVHAMEARQEQRQDITTKIRAIGRNVS